MSQPKRIWVLTYEYEPNIIGGLGIAATNLSRSLSNYNVKVTVISRNVDSRRPNISRKRNLSVIRFPLNRTFYGKKTRQFKPRAISRWLGKRGFALPKGIHIHSISFERMARYLQSNHRIPVVYTCHSLIVNEPGSMTRVNRMAIKQQIRLLKAADRVVVPSRYERAIHRVRYPFASHKTVVIHHGISNHLFTRSKRASDYHLLFVGRIVPMKGIEPLLHAVALLKRRRYPVKLDLAGSGSKRYERSLKRLARRLGVTRNVRWLGYRPQKQILALYRTHGVMIMPSRQESFGLVALEALASGIPLVSTRAGGLREFVNSRVAQTITRPTGPAIAQAILNVWNNRKQTERRIVAGRQVAKRYRWSTAARKYLRLFQQIEKQRRLQSRAVRKKGGQSW